MSIFDFQKPEDYLRHSIRSLPKEGWGVSRKLANHLGVNTSLISLVLTGRQALSLEQAFGVTKFFAWGKLESKYFLLMVQAERAGTQELKEFYLGEMAALKEQSLKLSARLENFKGLSEEQRTRFYSSTLYSKMRMYCSLSEEGKSAQQIQEEFDLSFGDLQAALDFLIQAGLLELVGGRYIPAHQHTHLEKDSPHLVRHHTNWRLESIRHAERLSDSELMFTGPMSMSEEDFKAIREELVQLIKKTVTTMKDSASEVMVCLNIDWILLRGKDKSS